MTAPNPKQAIPHDPAEDLDSIRTPEEEECDRKVSELAVLENQLADAELELATLRGELKVFDGQYREMVAPLMAEMEEVREGAAEARARQRAEEEELAACSSATQRAEFCPPSEMKTLFREVAKNIHPDLATSGDERLRRDEVMAQANAAYANGDRGQLRKLLLEWKADPGAIRGDDAVARLVRTIRQIAQVKNRTAASKRELRDLRSTDLYFLRKRAERASHEGRDLLEEMRTNLKQQIAQQRERLAQSLKRNP